MGRKKRLLVSLSREGVLLYQIFCYGNKKEKITLSAQKIAARIAGKYRVVIRKNGSKCSIYEKLKGSKKKHYICTITSTTGPKLSVVVHCVGFTATIRGAIPCKLTLALPHTKLMRHAQA